MNIHLQYNSNNTSLSFAAEELSKYLCFVNNNFNFFKDSSYNKEEADLSIELSVDENNRKDKIDFYHIHINKKEGFISGSNERSVLLGVYAYLKELGFRFLLPGKTYMPESLKEEDLYCSFFHQASLNHRGVCIEGANSIENILDFIDWLPKVGYNSFFVQFKEPFIFLNRWYDHTCNLYKEKEALSQDFYEECYAKIAEAILKRSLLYHAGGHGWTCEAVGQPSIGWVKADEIPSPEHQQLIAQINGKRTFIDGIPMNTNLCYSNPDAIDAFCNTVVSYVETHPYVDYLHIWLADEVNHICECEECKKTLPTDQYIHILNLIDQRIMDKNLSCKFVFLLYQELLYPPVHERILHPEHFILMFAPISRSFNKSYPDKIHEVPLPEYKRNKIELSSNIDENLTYLKKWQEIFSGDSLDYDYPLGRAHYGDLGYVNISKVLANDIKNLPNLGLNGYLSCQELRAFLPNSLPNYVMGYLLLDTGKSFQYILDEYYQAAYGLEYKKVISYLTQVSEFSNCDYFNRIGPRTNPTIADTYEKLLTTFENFKPYIEKVLGEKKAETYPNQKLHLFFWELLNFHCNYGILLSKALIFLANGEKESAESCYNNFCHYIFQMESDFQPYLDVYRIVEVSTKYTGFSFPTI